ncbi:hypothetical protein F2Q69_00038783, partial [Brassica cretica]
VTVHDGVSESPDRYDTFDLSDNLIFAIDGGIRNIRRKRVLCDYTGIPLPSMKTMIKNKNKKNIELYFGTYSCYIGYFFKLFEPIHNTLLAEVVHDFSWGGLICRFRICRRVTCNRRKYVQSTLDKISTSLSWFHICILFKIRSENDEL